jgi:hypothetical protein
VTLSERVHHSLDAAEHPCPHFLHSRAVVVETASSSAPSLSTSHASSSTRRVFESAQRLSHRAGSRLTSEGCAFSGPCDFSSRLEADSKSVPSPVPIVAACASRKGCGEAHEAPDGLSMGDEVRLAIHLVTTSIHGVSSGECKRVSSAELLTSSGSPARASPTVASRRSGRVPSLSARRGRARTQTTSSRTR